MSQPMRDGRAAPEPAPDPQEERQDHGDIAAAEDSDSDFCEITGEIDGKADESVSLKIYDTDGVVKEEEVAETEGGRTGPEENDARDMDEAGDDDAGSDAARARRLRVRPRHHF